MFELDGKTAFITGGASGIGLAVAKAFQKANADVVIADVAIDTNTEVQSVMKTVACDVSDESSMQTALDETRQLLEDPLTSSC